MREAEHNEQRRAPTRMVVSANVAHVGRFMRPETKHQELFFHYLCYRFGLVFFFSGRGIPSKLYIEDRSRELVIVRQSDSNLIDSMMAILAATRRYWGTHLLRFPLQNRVEQTIAASIQTRNDHSAQSR